MHNLTTLVINWHLTEACNFSCRYCYAAWAKPDRTRELWRNTEQTMVMLNALYQFFHPSNQQNPLRKCLDWHAVRLNLAGGEPSLAGSHLPTLIEGAHNIGFDVSIISNGSHLTDLILEQIAPKLSWLALSIDSQQATTNQSIGRTDSHGRLINLNSLASSLRHLQQQNPRLRLKLNTVVNRLNHKEDLTPLIQQFAPDKWKVLRMLPVLNDNLAISDQEFAAFINRHRQHAPILFAEDNQDMRDSYLMIDPHGRFFQNSTLAARQGYTYSRPILDVGVATAFNEINFDYRRFGARYIPTIAEA